ncbi:MAG: hypothetical protein U1E65_14000 [Myxococcota bacterium]
MRSLTICTFLVPFLACATPTKSGPVGSVSVEVDRVLPQAESIEASAVEITLAIMNPTDSPVTVASVDYSIDTKDVSGVQKGTATSGQSIQAQQKAELKFRQTLPLPAEAEAYKAVFEKETIPIGLKGVVKLGDGTKLDFERDAEVAVPALPRFIVNDAQAARYGSDGVDVAIFLRLVNDNVFPLLISSADYTVYVNDKKVRSETCAVGTRVLAGSAEEYEVSKTIGGKGTDFSAAEVKDILSKGQLHYRVEGKIELARITIPFQFDGTIQLATGE